MVLFSLINLLFLVIQLKIKSVCWVPISSFMYVLSLMSKNKSKFLKPSFVIYTWAIFKTGLIFTHSYLSNSWNKRGGGAKVPELINEVVGINVEGWKNSKSVSLSPFIREIWVRGHSKTTWTNFCLIYLPIVDFRGHLVHHLPFVHVVIEENWPYIAYVNLTI